MKVKIDLDIDEILQNILQNDKLIDIMIKEINKKHQIISSKEDISINDIFNNVKPMKNTIKEPNNILLSINDSVISNINKKQGKRGRPRKSCKIETGPGELISY